MSDRINVIRAPRDSEHAYFAVSRALTQDKRLSFEARGVLAYLLSKPSDWIVRIQDLQKEGSCGRDRIYRILKELRDAGYLHRDQEHQPNGAFVWGPYRVYEQPFTDKADMVAQHQEATQPFTENTDTVKPDTVNTEMVKRGKQHQEATQPFTPLPYTENTHVYKEEKSTDQRFLKKRESERPTHTPAVQAYFDTYPTERLNADQIAEINATVTDIPKWLDVLRYWKASNYRAQSIPKMLDRYSSGATVANDRPGGNGRVVAVPHIPIYEVSTDTRTELSADARRAIMRRKDT
jgi:hypothetical protein